MTLTTTRGFFWPSTVGTVLAGVTVVRPAGRSTLTLNQPQDPLWTAVSHLRTLCPQV